MIKLGECGRRFQVLPMDECYHCQAPAEREAGSHVGTSAACCIVFECGAVHFYHGDLSWLMAPCGEWKPEPKCDHTWGTVLPSGKKACADCGMPLPDDDPTL